jgi:hypothetical protein
MVPNKTKFFFLFFYQMLVRNGNGYPRVRFFYIHTLSIIYRVRNLDIYKLFIGFWVSKTIYYLLLFINK